MLDKVKAYLKITWNDEDATVNDMVARGQAYLNGLAGAALNFDTEGLPQTLLLDYCRYVYNNASEYFEENYQKEILRLQLEAGVANMPEVVEDEA